MKLIRLKQSGRCERRGSRGFTLAELIVVLVIISILAVVGVVSAVAYIKRSKFEKNEQNAITVYQTAQTAMSQMTSAGTMDAWIRDLIADNTIDHINALTPIAEPKANETVGETVYLTYNPGMPNNESKVLHDLLSNYIYDQTIFSGTITVEFFISMTYDSNGLPYYSARVKSAFYSYENPASVGWDADYVDGSADGLPKRDVNFRYSTSHVGYFDGTESSAKPNVNSVFLPRTQLYIVDGHITGPTEDPNASTVGYLFNLRNGETLDVSWAFFDEDGNLHGIDDRNEEITITLHDAQVGNAASFGDVVLTIGPDTLDNVRFDKLAAQAGVTSETIVERINAYTITRNSYDATVDVKVKRGTNTYTYTFPITVTKVEGDGRTGCPVGSDGKPAAYIEYSLSLDCMMVRTDEALGSNTMRYSSERLFSTDAGHSIPRNIYASITGKFDYTNDQSNIVTRNVPLTYAARAMDDPVYFTGMTGTTYIYDLPNKTVEGKTINDDDNTNNAETGSTITGKCIVNTLFGDAVYNGTVGGTSWTSNGGDAVFTSYRHLYNIRWIDSSKTANYRIIRDLNWYVHSGDKYTSEVRVYMSPNRTPSDRVSYGYEGVRYRSPAENSNLHIVSFPAICKLGQNQTLTSMSTADGKKFSINNVQMRAASFRNGTDSGYGLVCTNYGTIYNIYTNNLNIVIHSVTDGSSSDYDLISPSGTVTISNSGTMTLNTIKNFKVGGLVGNNLGSVGANTINGESIDENVNTVCMNNCIVIAGNYWDLAYYNTGGVIGQNEGSTNGVIKICGSFAVAGGGPKPDEVTRNASVGGIIGDNKKDINARLVVDGIGNASQFKAEITLPDISQNGSEASCIIAGCGHVGGAIGWTENNNFTYVVDQVKLDSISKNTSTGAVTFPDRTESDYQIDVTLPIDSLVLKVASNDDRCVGGAIGKINNSKGSYLSIRVNNKGNIITTDTTKSVRCGGVIGEESGCTIETTYLDVTNGINSRIGHITDTTGPSCAGGAYGIIISDTTNRTILINASNDGTIVSRGSDNGQGSGGTIGGINSSKISITLVLNVINGDSSNIIGTGNDNSKANGVGGAIGGMGSGIDTGSPEFTSDTVIYAENAGSISGKYHVGGAVGNAPINNGKIYAVNFGTISGTDFVGGAVGNITYDHFGTIQSILDSGSRIQANNFVGGAAGRITKFQDYAVVRTIVKGNSYIDKNTGSLVGGICGDLRIGGTGIGGTIELKGGSSDPVLTVKGKDGVGGAIGLMRSELVNKASVVAPDQSSNNKLVVQVTGSKNIGGVIGCIRASNVGVNEQNISTLFSSDNAIITDISVSITAKLSPRSYIEGSGDNVGGAVGYIHGKFDKNSNSYGTFGGSISLTTASGSTTGTAYVSGKRYVGGAVGHFEGLVPTKSSSNEGGITVDLSSALWDVIATVSAGNEADVGGAVGYFQGEGSYKYGTNDNEYPIKVNLGPTRITTSGFNVGGAIGRNNVRNGIITANNISGTISGQYNIGGAIGLNESRFTEANATVLAGGEIKATGVKTNNVANNNADGAKGRGSNVGGVVGLYYFNSNSNPTITSRINATISGTVIGTGDNVGGAIGYCYSSRNVHLIQNIIATLQGDGLVQGNDNVGGALGFSQSNITNVTSTISGTSSIIGVNRVGGAIGWAYANDQANGADVLSEAKNITGYSISQLETELSGKLYTSSGRIASIVSTISADYALQGFVCVGGAVGQSGYKTDSGGNKYSSPALVDVKAIINTGYLFDPFETGIESDEINPIDITKQNKEGAKGNACIGGVIGLVVDGRINSVNLSGTGGVINTDSQYPCPRISMNNAVLLAAKGNSVGGIIGQIGLLGYGKDNIGTNQTDGGAQNVTVSNISSSGTLKICVVSMNGANKIGGWIGSGYGVFGGIGNRTYDDYKKTNDRAVYNVNNVRYVYSAGNYVGGFCGYSRGYRKNNYGDNNKQPGLVTWADINMGLNGTTICGSSGVGGAFGCIEGVKFASGCINVDLNNHSIIGDPSGSRICKEAGGAIGYLRNETESFGIPVKVTIDSSSKIYAAGGSAETSGTYGVGGAFGRCSGVFGRLKYDNNYYNCAGTFTVESAVPNSVSVYSLYSNVGGVIGVMDSVNVSGYIFNNSTSYWSYAEGVTVQTDGDNAFAGGFAGKINSLSGDMYNCYCNGPVSVIANGTGSCAGGFAGYAALNENSRKINSCYTTAEVKAAAGAYTGGFVGQLFGGTVSNCYVGGRTYQGSYVAGEGNITGKANVGGFVGATTGTNSVTIDNCYSTASVLGAGDNIGGFIGNATSTTTIKNSYCTGRVVGPNAGTYGSFAGNVGTSSLNNYKSNQVMSTINPGDDFPLIGSLANSSIGENNIKYAEDAEIGVDTSSCTVHPFDTSLEGTYVLRPVIGNEHYGDWPLPVDGAPLDGAAVKLKFQTGVDEQNNPIYEWFDFENDTFEYVFNGTAVTIAKEYLEVYVQGTIVDKENYDIYYRDNNKVGKATITFAAKSESRYSGAVSRTFKINAANIEDASAVINKASEVYTGADIDPDVTVTYNGVTLVRDTDYTLAYDRDGNLEAGYDNDHSSIGSTTVYAIGKGNYTGTKMIGPFEITTIDLSLLNDEDIVLIGADNLVYDEDEEGNPVEHKPDVAVRYNGQTINGIKYDENETDYEYTRGKDYVITYENNTAAGTAYLVITGTADPSVGTGSIYTGVKREPFTISPAKNSWVEGQEPAIVGWTYGDDPNEPTGTLKYGNIDYAFYSDVSCSEASKIADISTVGAGNYYVKVFAEASDNYTGPEAAILIFTITPKSINGISSVSISPDEYLYTGDPIEISKETITVTIDDGEKPAYELGQDDFTIESYDPADHKDPGEVEFTVAGTGNYTGTATGKFTIYCEYMVQFISNGQIYDSLSVREGKSVKETKSDFADPENTGYRFDGWYTDQEYTSSFSIEDPISGDVTVYAKWVKYWEITFVTGDPDVVIADNPQHVDQGKYAIRPADPERTGYHFDGWYNEFGILYEFDTMVYEDITLTARWTPTYNVSFDTGEGGPAVDSQEVVEGKQATAPSDPVWDGHHFSGWYSDATYATEYDFDTPVTEAITIYAKWTYKVSFDTGEDGSDVEPQYVSENGQATEPSDPTREGYHFAGWYSDEECTTEYDFDTPVVADITLYAKWAYKVTFSTGSGSAVAPQLVVKDGKAQEPADPPVWEGHTFKGWYSDEGCTQLYDFATLVKGDITIYAKWE